MSQPTAEAIALNASYASAHFGRAHSLWMSGRPDQALKSHDEAMRLSPRDPLMWAFQASKAIALILLGQYDDALHWARLSQGHANTALWAFMSEVSALGSLGRIDEAKAAFERVKLVKPDATCSFATRVLPITHDSDRERFVSGLKAAGVPD